MKKDCDGETAGSYDWSDFMRLLRERDGRTIAGWCRIHGFSYGSVCNLIYGIWSDRQGYGPVALRIIRAALEDGLIRKRMHDGEWNGEGEGATPLRPIPASGSNAPGGR